MIGLGLDLLCKGDVGAGIGIIFVLGWGGSGFSSSPSWPSMSAETFARILRASPFFFFPLAEESPSTGLLGDVRSLESL